MPDRRLWALAALLSLTLAACQTAVPAQQIPTPAPLSPPKQQPSSLQRPAAKPISPPSEADGVDTADRGLVEAAAAAAAPSQPAVVEPPPEDGYPADPVELPAEASGLETSETDPRPEAAAVTAPDEAPQLPEPEPQPLLPEPGPPSAPDEIDHLLQAGLERGDFSGATVMVLQHGDVAKHSAYGLAYSYDTPSTPASEPIAMQTDTLIDLASLTKLFTATAIAQLVERGQVELDAPVARYLPGAMGDKPDVKVRHLLTRGSGFPPGPSFRQMEMRDADAILGAVQLQSTPGAAFRYSDLDFVALGRVAEAASGMPLDQYMQQEIFDRLGMSQTGFKPRQDRQGTAATEYHETPVVGRQGLVWGEVHDPLAWSIGGVAGNAGLFSTAQDVAIFGQALLDGGVWRGQRILTPESVSLLTSHQRSAPGGGAMGLGFELNQPWFMGGLSTSTAFGHTGFTGTSLVVSPTHGAVVVLLANRLHPLRNESGVNRYRQGVADAAAAGL